MRPSNFLNSLSLATLANSLPTSSRNSSGYAVSTPPLDTPWTYQVGTNPWPQYPRPQRQREKWQNLNGIWAYENATSLDALDNPPFNQTLSKPILVPSCIESGLSGVQGRFALYSWYSTSFEVPSDWSGQQVLLNFGAVDYEATVFVNGHNATFHRGGYFSFEVDITDYLNGGNNELLVFTHDPTDSDPYVIPIGKQTLHQSHIFYTPCSGIWQSVWIEAAPVNYITDLHLSADMHGQVNATVSTLQSSAPPAEICIYDRSSGQELARHTCTANSPCLFSVPSPKLWSPDTPNLYDIKVQMGQDSISSYTGFRSIGRAVVNGVVRPLLNGDFFFQFGTLDQGFWPDGIYTPPSLEAMVYDLKMLKKLGFNGLRKHIKVENALYYQACDELGLLLLQDMPAMRPLQTKTFSNCTVAPILPDTNQQAEFQRQLEMLIIQQRNFPSIGTWIIYNEGWGQLAPPEAPYFPEFGLTDLVRQLDPTRLVNSNTGWYVVDLPNAIAPELETLADWSESPFYRYDHGAGDYSDNHHYANPQCGSPFYSIQSSPYDPSRIGFQGEFGGIGNNVSIEHLWNVQEAINTINQTYEIDETMTAWNFRAHALLTELLTQVDMFACSGGIWTQTTDVEGEVNGLMTYDRRILRPNVAQWQNDIHALYAAAAARGKQGTIPPSFYPPNETSTVWWGVASHDWLPDGQHWNGLGYNSGWP